MIIKISLNILMEKFTYTTSDLKIKESLAIFEEEAKNNNETLDFVKIRTNQRPIHP